MLRKHIVPALGERLVAEVEYKDILAFHNSLHHMPTVANCAADILVKMFNLADAWGWRPSGSNPCRGVPRFRVEKHERFLTREELFRLGEALRAAPAERLASTHAAAAIRLLVLTGCRRNEILGLRWDDLNFDTGEMRLPDTKTGTRMVPLTPAVARVFDSLSRTPGNQWVFPGRKKGARLVNLNDSWDRVRKRAGLEDVRLHDLRHYSGIRLIPGLTRGAGGERARWALVFGIITGGSRMQAGHRRAGIVRAACAKARSGPWPALSVSGRRADRCTWSRQIMPSSW